MTLTFELLTLKLVRLIAHGVLNLALVGDTGLCVPSNQVWSSKAFEDIAHLLCEH